MKYEELYEDFKEVVPDSKEYLENVEADLGLDNSDGMHVLFGSAVRPYIYDTMKRGDTSNLDLIAAFIEAMETSDDIHVTEVAEQSIMEYLLGQDRALVEKYGDIWGEKTKEGFISVGRFVL